MDNPISPNEKKTDVLVEFKMQPAASLSTILFSIVFLFLAIGRMTSVLGGATFLSFLPLMLILMISALPIGPSCDGYRQLFEGSHYLEQRNTREQT